MHLPVNDLPKLTEVTCRQPCTHSIGMDTAEVSKHGLLIEKALRSMATVCIAIPVQSQCSMPVSRRVWRSAG